MLDDWRWFSQHCMSKSTAWPRDVIVQRDNRWGVKAGTCSQLSRRRVRMPCLHEWKGKTFRTTRTGAWLVVLILTTHAISVYEEKAVRSKVIWPVHPESMIQLMDSWGYWRSWQWQTRLWQQRYRHNQFHGQSHRFWVWRARQLKVNRLSCLSSVYNPHEKQMKTSHCNGPTRDSSSHKWTLRTSDRRRRGCSRQCFTHGREVKCE